jgi:predicted MPP superfamily phosphohydrolase
MTRFVAYLIACWGVVIALAAGAGAAPAVATGAIALYATLPIFIFLRQRRWSFYPSAAFRLLVVRPALYVQLLLPFVVVAGVLGALVGVPFARVLWGGQVAALGMLAAGSVLLVTGYIGTRRLVVRRVDAEVPGLPVEFDELCIAQLSDLHVGPQTPRAFLQRIVEATNALGADLIAVTGDLVDDRSEDVTAYIAGLGGLEAPLGVFMIPGNHDIMAGWDAVHRSLRAARIGTVLVNSVHMLRRGNASLALVGTGDPAARRRGPAAAAPDIAQALRAVPSDITVVALAHNPALWPLLVERGVAVTLSGHTHWGQFAVPHLDWSLASPFVERAMGAHQEESSLLYINPGTGYWGIPFRIGASPEITLVTLRRSDVAAARVHRARAA